MRSEELAAGGPGESQHRRTTPASGFTGLGSPIDKGGLVCMWEQEVGAGGEALRNLGE